LFIAERLNNKSKEPDIIVTKLRNKYFLAEFYSKSKLLERGTLVIPEKRLLVAGFSVQRSGFRTAGPEELCDEFRAAECKTCTTSQLNIN
jgi:hypothetical protein